MTNLSPSVIDVTPVQLQTQIARATATTHSLTAQAARGVVPLLSCLSRCILGPGQQLVATSSGFPAVQFAIDDALTFEANVAAGAEQVVINARTPRPLRYVSSAIACGVQANAFEDADNAEDSVAAAIRGTSACQSLVKDISATLRDEQPEATSIFIDGIRDFAHGAWIESLAIEAGRLAR